MLNILCIFILDLKSNNVFNLLACYLNITVFCQHGIANERISHFGASQNTVNFLNNRLAANIKIWRKFKNPHIM